MKRKSIAIIFSTFLISINLLQAQLDIRATHAINVATAFISQNHRISQAVHSPMSTLTVAVKTNQAAKGALVKTHSHVELLSDSKSAQTTSFDLANGSNDLLSQVFVPGKNLYNKTDKRIETGKYITDTGTRVNDSNYSISAPIPVIGNTAYTVNNISFMCYYAADMITVVGGEAFDRTERTRTTPAKAKFVRITVPNNQRDSFRFQLGTTLDDSDNLVTTEAANKTSTSGLQSLRGKRVLWLGTSIPKLGQYPELACVQIGATCVNNAVSSSTARRKKANGSIGGISYYMAAWNLSSTVAEKQALIDNYAVLKDSLAASSGQPSSGILSKSDKAILLGTSYENLILPFLQGKAMVDLVIFNHNFNDMINGAETSAQFATMPANPFDRNTYIGAINYLIREIMKVNPRMRVALVSHYENQLYPHYGQADDIIASYWEIPVLRLYEQTGFSQRTVPGTRSLWNKTGTNYAGPRGSESTSQDMTMQRYMIPDGVHPSSDPTGKTQAFLGRIIAKFLAALL